jgi:hypothetical protein
MLADVYGTAEGSRLAREARAGKSARGFAAGPRRGSICGGLVALIPRPVGLLDLTTERVVVAGGLSVSCARTRGGGGFDGLQGVRRRCPALHRFRM